MFKNYIIKPRKHLWVALFTLFSVWGFAQTPTCTAYEVGNINNFCGCTAVQFVPYGLYLETPNGCVEYFKADTVQFIVSSDSSAYLKGTFRSFNDFRPVLVDVRFAKTTTRNPRLELCNRDSSTAVAASWRYFGAMSGTIKFDADPVANVTSRNGTLQMGTAAAGQVATTFGAAGQFALSNGRVGGFGFSLANPKPVTCPAPINPCLGDTEPPTFRNCPANISVNTTTSSATATWTPPTAVDNCSTPSVTSGFTSGQSFPLGVSNVVYTAQDALGNRSECRFSVTVTQVVVNTGCVKYDVNNTNNRCGCTVSQFLPYGIYLLSLNACGQEFYQADSVNFVINADSTATLKGTFRSSSWTPLVVDIFFQKTTLKLPKLELCNRDSNPSIAATWRYFGNMTGTLKLASDAPVSVSSRNGLFQVGAYANGQNNAALGASGQFALSNGQQGGFGFSLSNPQNETVPPTFANCPANISVNSPLATAVATWTAPTATDNCSTPSVSSNFTSGQTFPVGTTTVVYTAKDSANNTNECRFTVTVKQVIPITGCVKYDVKNSVHMVFI
jgi:HYR domain